MAVELRVAKASKIVEILLRIVDVEDPKDCLPRLCLSNGRD